MDSKENVDNINIFSKEKIASFNISSKSTIYHVTSIYIFLNNEEAKSLFTKEKMEISLSNYLKLQNLVSFEIEDNYSFSIFFDFEKFKSIFNKTIMEYPFFPFSYQIHIHSHDMKEPEVYYQIILTTDKLLINEKQKTFGIRLKSIEAGEEFTVVDANGEYNKYNIIHEEKKNKNKM